MTGLMPTLPGKTRGVVDVTVGEDGRNAYTLQCENCFTLETPRILSQMKAVFHRAGDDRRRLCPACRASIFAACECFPCKDDRRGA